MQYSQVHWVIPVRRTAGDHVSTQNRFFERLELRRRQISFDGLVISWSAGSIKCAELVYGFVLGLIVDLSERYLVTSNRESGSGRFDVMLEPRDTSREDAIILEFKVQDAREKELSDTVSAALRQIEGRPDLLNMRSYRRNPFRCGGDAPAAEAKPITETQKSFVSMPMETSWTSG